ncbi:hypothetical protein SERLA73DRAFT_116865 [Serpula lacrymans var. lacrymans S7.3]|uniref:Phosphatidylglycerol lysyltransferase C-terminal domain-containing protein n=1 Tax=Serpula lacrymans var. lacrymans (strain S7.3) TaxID=936435 RepID=F8QG07_SERL3|nr:hypothetical protein SERLA73DRAFT_116865 [Serpula lacrymans var. lacrymans S7.3]
MSEPHSNFNSPIVPVDSHPATHPDLPDLIAKYGSSTSTAWLETDRYSLWSPSHPIHQSEFTPVQGYLHKHGWLFAWGSPLVSHPSALKPTVDAFLTWVQSLQIELKPVWCCVDSRLEALLADMGWATVSCISEDVVDPEHLLELTSDDAKGKEGGASVVKDLKKNLRRADKDNVIVEEMQKETWSHEDKSEVDKGVEAWKKSRSGIQIASTSFLPWLDYQHRRYWVARQDGKPVGLLILTPVKSHYVIKNAVSFPKAPKGTSEALIHSALRAINEESRASTQGVDRHSPGANGNTNVNHSRESDATQFDGSSSENENENGKVEVTFSISAAPSLDPVKNVSGWKFTWLNKTYKKVSESSGLFKRGDFRSKFHGAHEPMFVCYPTEDGFGLDGIETLLRVLRK